MDTVNQNKVEKLFLVAISDAADFKVNPVYYYNPQNSKKVLPEIQKIPDEKLIFFCDIQDETICKFLPSQNPYEIVKLNYNHLFIGHFKEVSNIIAQNVIN